MSKPPVAVIMGGTGSVGCELVPMLIDRGFKVAVSYLIPEQAEHFEERFDYDEDQMIIRRVDATDPAAVEACMEEAYSRFGPINVVVSLVGIWAGGRDVTETKDLRFDRMIDVNLRTAWNVTKAGIGRMDKDWGRIVLMGSKHSEDTPAGQAAYNVAKAGVLALAKSVATELRDTNTTCNALLPSVINTDATRALLPFAEYVHWPQPLEVAQVINFLASRESTVINGAGVPVLGSTIV